MTKTIDFGETVVIQLSNSATSMATKLNGNFVSQRRLHSTARHAHDSTVGFVNHHTHYWAPLYVQQKHHMRCNEDTVAIVSVYSIRGKKTLLR